MKFTELALPGVFLLEPEIYTDERGMFMRQFCRAELARHGLDFSICQCNISTNTKTGTLRRLHYQKEPYPEIKSFRV